MRRKACALLLSAALGGCTSMDRQQPSPGCSGSWGKQNGPPPVPGVMGPNGQNIPMAAPYNMVPPGNHHAARQMMSNSVPLDMVQINRGGAGVPGMAPTPIPPGGVLTPPGVPFAPGMPGGPFAPGAAGIKQTGFTPDGRGPSPANLPPGANPGGAMLAQYTPPPVGPQVPFNIQRTQIRFTRPTGMKVSWFAQGPDGKPAFSNVPLEAPARYNFPQGAIYRLRISGIEGRPGLEVYPTMEVVPCNPKTEAFLAHSAVPLEFTQDDFKQIAEGNYVTKVIYLPDPQFQDVAGSGTDEIISTRLEPGADPVQEALRRGSILVILRMGNVDQEAPNTPPLGAVVPVGPPPVQPFTPGAAPPGFMAPYFGKGALPPGGPMIPPSGPLMQPPPGFNPNMPPPGFNPNMPPPGFIPNMPPAGLQGNVPPGFNPNMPPPGFSPPVPQAGTVPPDGPGGANVLFPPSTSIFAPPAPTPSPVPPSAPATSNVETKQPAAVATPKTVKAKSPSDDLPPVAPTPTSAAPKTAGVIPLPPGAPSPMPGVPRASDVTVPPMPSGPSPVILNNKIGDANLAPLPLVPLPGANDAKKVDPAIAPLPLIPTSKGEAPLSTVTPASAASPMPMLPEVDGPPVVPAFPATAGTIRPGTTNSTVPGSTPRMPMPSDGAQAR